MLLFKTNCIFLILLTGSLTSYSQIAINGSKTEMFWLYRNTENKLEFTACEECDSVSLDTKQGVSFTKTGALSGTIYTSIYSSETIFYTICYKNGYKQVIDTIHAQLRDLPWPEIFLVINSDTLTANFRDDLFRKLSSEQVRQWRGFHITQSNLLQQQLTYKVRYWMVELNGVRYRGRENALTPELIYALKKAKTCDQLYLDDLLIYSPEIDLEYRLSTGNIPFEF